MSPITATSTTTLMIVVCSRASPINMIVTMATTSEGLAALGHCDVVLPPQLTPGDPVRGSVGLTTVLQQQHPQSQMPSQD